MPSSKSADIIWGCIAALIFVAGLGGSYYFYMQDQQMRAETAAKNQEIKVIQAKIKSYPSLLVRLDKLESDEKQLLAFIPNQEQQKEFVWELEEMADSSGVKISQCEILKDIKHLATLPQFSVYQWKLSLRADFAGLNKFLSAVPLNRRAVMVSDLNIAAQPPPLNSRRKTQYILNVNMTLDLLAKSDREKVAK